MINVGLWGAKSNQAVRETNDAKLLELELLQTKDQLESFRSIAFKYQRDFNALASQVSAFCRLILDSQYAQSQIGGNNMIADMDVFSLLRFAEQELNKAKANDRQLILDLSRQLKERDLELEGLKSQLSRYLLKEQYLSDGTSTVGEAAFVEPVNPPTPKTEEPSEAKPEKTAPILHETPSVPQTGNRGVMHIAILEDEDDLPMPQIPKQSSGHKPQSKKQARTNKSTNSPKREPASPPIEKQKVAEPASPQPQPQPQPEPPRPPEAKPEPAKVVIEEAADQAEKTVSPQSQHKSAISQTQQQATDQAIEQLKRAVENKSQKEEKEQQMVAHMVNLADYMEKMNDIMWAVLVAIGEKGFSESKDVKRTVIQGDITESAFNTALSQLRKMNIIDQEKISTGWRWFYAYELTDVGRRIFLEKYKKNPIDCEKQILKKEHTTALHGYCIKDAAFILKSVHGYDEATIDRKINSTKLFSGETYIPDVIAKKTSLSMVDYFEVELGHHTQADFNKKCDKMRSVTKDLYFIVPEASVKDKILARQIGQWTLDRGGKEGLKGITIYLTTMTKLNEGKWDNIYHFD